jgi:hypothetical protein
MNRVPTLLSGLEVFLPVSLRGRFAQNAVKRAFSFVRPTSPKKEMGLI